MTGRTGQASHQIPRGRIHLSQTLKMYDAYQSGATMEAVGLQFRCSKSAVQRAFSDWSLPVRNQGSPKREIVEVQASPSIVFVEAPRVTAWCEQCDQRVTPEQITACTSKWCKAKLSTRIPQGCGIDSASA